MQNTTNYNLNKPDGNDFVKIESLNENADIIDGKLKELEDGLNNIDFSTINQSIANVDNRITAHANDLVKHGVYGTATGTNTLIMTVQGVTSYPTGMLVAFKNTTTNTGATTLNINGLGAKSIKKSNGSDLFAGNLKTGGIYQCRYDGTSFFLLGEGGEYGTATASQVLTGYTYGTEEGIQNGSMSNNGAVSQTLNAGASYNIPAGYHNGSGRITVQTLANQTVANAVASEILATKTAWVNGSLVTGSMANNGAINQTLSANGTYTIPVGYHNGSGKVRQSLTTQAAQTITPGTTNKTIAANRYLTGIQTILGDADLIPANIKKGVDIFGVAGTVDIASLGGAYVAGGTQLADTNSRLEVRGLGFRPQIVLASANTSDYFSKSIYVDSTALGGNKISFYTDPSGRIGIQSLNIYDDGFAVSVQENANFRWIALGGI